jgi:hypothetical protein
MEKNEELKKKLEEVAKGKGLDLAEKTLEEICDLAFEIVEVLVMHTENKYDDMIFAAVKGKAIEFIKEKIDMIDGKEG